MCACMHACMACMHVCMYICMYVCIGLTCAAFSGHTVRRRVNPKTVRRKEEPRTSSGHTVGRHDH